MERIITNGDLDYAFKMISCINEKTGLGLKLKYEFETPSGIKIFQLISETNNCSIYGTTGFWIIQKFLIGLLSLYNIKDCFEEKKPEWNS